MDYDHEILAHIRGWGGRSSGQIMQVTLGCHTCEQCIGLKRWVGIKHQNDHWSACKDWIWFFQVISKDLPWEWTCDTFGFMVFILKIECTANGCCAYSTVTSPVGCENTQVLWLHSSDAYSTPLTKPCGILYQWSIVVNIWNERSTILVNEPPAVLLWAGVNVQRWMPKLCFSLSE